MAIVELGSRTSKAWGRDGFRTIHEEGGTGLMNSPG